MTDADVVVLGDDLAAFVAALAAAREDDSADVTLVTDGEPALPPGSALIDVLGYHDEDAAPVADPLELIDDLPAEHPYRTVGAEAVRAGLALFDDVMDDAYEGNNLPQNALLPTGHGFPKPVARYPASMAAGVLSKPADALLCGFEHVPSFDPTLAAERLDRAAVPFEVSGMTMEFPGAIDSYPPAAWCGRALDENDEPDDENSMATSRCDALAREVMKYVGMEKRIGFPAVLGLDRHAEVVAEIERQLGKAVFEVPIGSPNLPDRRLLGHLLQALETRDVTIETGRVHDVTSDTDAVESIDVASAGHTTAYSASSVVLASGGIAAGGLVATRQGVEEPIVGCHVGQPANRAAWTADPPLEPQPFARYGIDIDEHCRPTGASDEPTFGNLFAAGGILAGADPAAEHSAGGIALATGLLAGKRAVNESL